ncbi:hypothetical protein [Actinoplanes regularis]|uniref:Uncharacterized protein n=1 Tax=Actinoplanes regularis TaxID=52697 RepID=A0A238YF88_9ACTN|nr:hypothetical protein [Actinoplanes regularis]GIE85986.1 hypothetical protein Are01nite_24660 [Actinoplanes regularis]SNR69029.1 hypothetical protein SAMN06264365_104462 [Actinoplanes regularis]
MKRTTGLLAAGLGLMVGGAAVAGPVAAATAGPADSYRPVGCCGIPGPAGDLGGQISDSGKRAGGQFSDAGKRAGGQISDAGKRAGGQISGSWRNLNQQVNKTLRKASGECNEPTTDAEGNVDERPTNPDKCGDSTAPVSTPTSSTELPPYGSGPLM